MKKYIKYFILAFVLSLIVAPVRGGYFEIFGITGFRLATLIGSCLFYIFTVICIYKGRKRLKPGYIALAIAVGCSIVELPLSIFTFKSTMNAHPELIFRYLSIAAAYFTFSLKPVWAKILAVVANFALLMWMIFVGYVFWFNKTSYGTWTGHVEQVVESPFIFDSPTGEPLSLDHFKGSYVVLDCWNSGCGYCFEAFPYVQALYDKYKGSSDIRVMGLHCRNERYNETYLKGTQLLVERGYTFPCLSVDIKNTVLSDLGVDGFPTVLIFDTAGKLILRGNIEVAAKHLDKLKSD